MDKKEPKADTQITPLYLKTLCNKFEVETIFILNISNQSVSSLGNIDECINLMMLDASSNGIKDITPLQKLTKLQVLKLGKNFVTSIDPLKDMTKLVQVDMHGNQVKNMKSLSCLSQNKWLTTVYFQLLNGTFKSPICEETNYRETVFDVIKSLKRLDGMKKGEKCSTGELVRTKAELKYEIKNSTDYWYAKDYPKVEGPKAVKLEDGEVNKSIEAVNNLIKALEKQMKA